MAGPPRDARIHHALPAVQARSLAHGVHGHSGGVAGCQQRRFSLPAPKPATRP
jgi:hypothetical protein